jgi:hypothetical protein
MSTDNPTPKPAPADVAPARKKPRVTSAREARKKHAPYLLEVARDIWFRIRPIDIVQLVFTGAIPLPMSDAVDKLNAMRRAMGTGEAQIEDLIPKDVLQNAKEVFRRIALKAVIDPPVTDSKYLASLNDDLLWVGGISDIPAEVEAANGRLVDEDGDFSIAMLLEIWKAVSREGGVNVMSDDEAEAFRAAEPEFSGTAVLDGAGVRAEAVIVDPHAGNTEGTEPARTDAGTDPRDRGERIADTTGRIVVPVGGF